MSDREGVTLDEDGGTLFVVPTPLGNLEDMTPRARRILTEVRLIAAEDTRRTRHLLEALGLPCPRLVSYRDANERKLAPRLVRQLQEGDSIALVSDAGTPTISDPGYHLVRAAAEAGVPVVSLPGPCALATAVAGSGLPSARVSFLGFLPPKPGARRRLLEAYGALDCTLVIYLAPHRTERVMADLVEALGAAREAVLARELTKRHEEWIRLPLGELAEQIAAGFRGEGTLVIAPPPAVKRVHRNKYAHLAGRD